MSRLAKVVWVVALLFALLNLAGAIYAAVRGEPIHTGIHAGLLLLSGFVVWRITPRRVAVRY